MTNTVDRIDPETERQIAGLSLSRRPLIICDVDEVALHFIEPLERHLEDNGYRLIARSYGLTGNIVGLADGIPAGQGEVRRMLYSFFDQHTANQKPVDGVTETLTRFADLADIIMLSSIPSVHRDLRGRTLTRHGIPFPVITNTGPKGPAVQMLSEHTNTVFFLDDSPSNIRSVRRHVPKTDLIHFIADRRFFELADPIDGVHLRANDWPTVSRYIADRMESL